MQTKKRVGRPKASASSIIDVTSDHDTARSSPLPDLTQVEHVSV